jgi:ribulose-phosphate 3-epimerase
MIEVLPSINKSTWQEVEADIKKIESFADWVELDIADGTLSQVKTWNNSEDLKTLQTVSPLRIAIHLMMKDPEKYFKNWISVGARRVIIQYEGISGGFLGMKTKKIIKQIAEECKNNWVEFGISISPKTSVMEIKPFLGLVDVVQILSVPIGPGGQMFDEKQLEKVKGLRDYKARITTQGDFKYKIEWDGGVDLNTVSEIKDAGAEIIVSTSFIFGASNPEQAIQALTKIARE